MEEQGFELGLENCFGLKQKGQTGQTGPVVFKLVDVNFSQNFSVAKLNLG